MKLRSKLFFSALICLTLALLILLKKEKSVKISSIENSTVIDHVQNQNAAVQSSNQNKSVAITSEKNNSGSKTTNAQKNEEQTDQQGPLSAQEVESVHNIVKMISRTIAQKSNSNQFMKAIQNLHLTPKFIDEGNNNLGSMVTVRTSNSLEGTRYIHAQFTGPKNNADYLQHISFQIRPGSNSFQKAVEILNEYLPKNKVIKESTSD